MFASNSTCTGHPAVFTIKMSAASNNSRTRDPSHSYKQYTFFIFYFVGCYDSVKALCFVSLK